MAEVSGEIEEGKCFYCGAVAQCTDHIIPVSYYYAGKRKNFHGNSPYGKENLVPCCKECNSIASSKVFQNKDEKRQYIQERLSTKYSKVVKAPYWSEEEIEEMGSMLRKEIKLQQLARKWILNRINYPDEPYPRVELNHKIRHFLEKEI